MQSFNHDPGLTRRELLAGSLAAAGALAVGDKALARPAGFAPRNADGPFKLGLQSYSLRGLTEGGHSDLRKALSASRELGVHYWESFTAHVPMNSAPDRLKEIKAEIEAAGVQLNGYGVVHLGQNEAANRKIFEFARTMGLAYLSVDPDPKSFDLLDKLVDEYGVPIGIHNHGPGHQYALIDTIAKAIKDHNPKIGCCIDTGHFLRSREDPVRAVQVFANRIYGVHLKDVKNAETFTILGKGDLRTADMLKGLAAQKYPYCLAIEYEEKPEDPMDDIKACLAYAREVIGSLSGGA
jgi:sugar phosphate isomerase/epimerase